MARIYLYADETGNLDYDGKPDPSGGGASSYFGFGTATFTDNHSANLLDGLHLRADVTKQGLELPNGFHACNDSAHTRNEMFAAIARQAPRFDVTFLAKSKAYDPIKADGSMRLYKMAWWLHIKEIALRVAGPDDELFVIAAEFGTKRTRRVAESALRDVCDQVDRNITLCIWKAPTSWGLQVADYGLWATQRKLEGKKCTWFDPCIKPTLETEFFPWGRA